MFYIERTKSGRCLIINVATGFVVTVKNSTNKQGELIIVNPYDEN